MEHEVVIVVAGAGADGDVLDREVAAVEQFVAVVPRHELLLFHARTVHAEPHEVSGLHVLGVRDRLEVLKVADKFKCLQASGKHVTE